MNELNLVVEQTMSSTEIAALTNKNHPDVLRDIRKAEKTWANSGVIAYVPDEIRPKRCKEAILHKWFANKMLTRYTESRRLSSRASEEIALKTIEAVKGVRLIRQYAVEVMGKTYRIDGYDKENNVAYEIDGEEHKNKVRDDAIRERALSKHLGCTFVRISI